MQPADCSSPPERRTKGDPCPVAGRARRVRKPCWPARRRARGITVVVVAFSSGGGRRRSLLFAQKAHEKADFSIGKEMRKTLLRSGMGRHVHGNFATGAGRALKGLGTNPKPSPPPCGLYAPHSTGHGPGVSVHQYDAHMRHSDGVAKNLPDANSSLTNPGYSEYGRWLEIGRLTRRPNGWAFANRLRNPNPDERAS